MRHVVYLAARADRPGLVKVGIASDVGKRLRQIGRQLRTEVSLVHEEVVGTVAAEQVERAVHQMLAEAWVVGEWFAVSAAEAKAALARARHLLGEGRLGDFRKSRLLVPVASSVDPALKEAIRAQATADGVTVSALIESILREALLQDAKPKRAR